MAALSLRLALVQISPPEALAAWLRSAGDILPKAIKGNRFDFLICLANSERGIGTSADHFSIAARFTGKAFALPASRGTTHRQLTPAQQIAAGAGPNVVRLSIGIEDAGDLIADLDQALVAATA